MEQDYKYKVVTLCMTYNQSPYIEETLHGFTMQETSFPVVYCVVDDASIDGEQDLLRKWARENLQQSDDGSLNSIEMSYGELIFARHLDNVNAFFSILLLRENHYGKKSKLPYLTEWIDHSKYQAFCEGDDYWTSPQKLQMQVEFLDSNPEYVMCHTDFGLSNGKWRNHKVNLAKDDIYFPQCLFGELQIGTLTTLYRLDIYNKLPKLYMTKGWPMADTPLWIELSHVGKIKYMPEETACYRVLPNSASHGSFEKELSFIEAAREIHQFYAQYYDVDLKNDGYTKGYYISIMKSAFKHHRVDEAKKYFLEAKKKKSTCIKLYLFTLATCFKPFGNLIKRIYAK